MQVHFVQFSSRDQLFAHRHICHSFWCHSVNVSCLEVVHLQVYRADTFSGCCTTWDCERLSV